MCRGAAPRFHYPMLPAFALLAAAAGLVAAVEEGRRRLRGNGPRLER
jgi:hypothetical protein